MVFAKNSDICIIIACTINFSWLGTLLMFLEVCWKIKNAFDKYYFTNRVRHNTITVEFISSWIHGMILSSLTLLEWKYQAVHYTSYLWKIYQNKRRLLFYIDKRYSQCKNNSLWQKNRTQLNILNTFVVLITLLS